MTDSIVTKIRAILARAEEGRGATEEERDTAMKMAEKLLFKHNLSMEDISIADDDPGREFTRERDDLEPWSGTLLFRIAKVFFCDVYYWPTHSGSTRPHFIVGRRDNVQVVRELHAYIAQQIAGECAIEVTARGQCPRYARVAIENYAALQVGPIEDDQFDMWADELIPHLKGDEGLHLIMRLTGLTKSYASEVRPFIKRKQYAPEVVRDLGVWRRSFLDAAVTKVYLRLHEMHRKTVKEEGSKGTDLVVNEKARLEEYMKSLGLDLQKGGGSSRQHDFSGANAGSEAGGRVDVTLGNKVGRGGTRLLNQ